MVHSGQIEGRATTNGVLFCQRFAGFSTPSDRARAFPRRDSGVSRPFHPEIARFSRETPDSMRGYARGMSVRYTVNCPVDALVVGDEFARSEWPLHVTVVGNFDWDDTEDLLIERVGAGVLGHAAFELVVGDEAMFGAGHTVRVNRTVPSPRLDALHRSLLDDRMRIVEPQFLHEGFEGHITHFPAGRPTSGDRVRIEQVALAELAGPRAIVRRVWTLAG